MGVISLITGERGSGKTTFCQKYILDVRQSGGVVCGLICPGRFEDGVKTGIYAQDVFSGEIRLLASNKPDEIAGGMAFRRWYFNPEVLVWGNEIFNSITTCDLLMVDELGPLELVDGGGWQAALAVLGKSMYTEAWVVVRPVLVQVFRDRFQVTNTWSVGMDHHFALMPPEE